jgi:hypothetical protein
VGEAPVLWEFDDFDVREAIAQRFDSAIVGGIIDHNPLRDSRVVEGLQTLDNELAGVVRRNDDVEQGRLLVHVSPQ